MQATNLMETCLHRSVLLIEDDSGLATDLMGFLEEEGWQVDYAATVEEARSKLTEKVFDLLVADYLLPDANALSLFGEVQLRSPLTKILVITGVRNVQIAAESFKKGAGGFIFKPFTLDEFQKRIDELMEEQRLESERDRHKKAPTPLSQPINMVGRSPAMDTLQHRKCS